MKRNLKPSFLMCGMLFMSLQGFSSAVPVVDASNPNLLGPSAISSPNVSSVGPGGLEVYLDPQLGSIPLGSDLGLMEQGLNATADGPPMLPVAPEAPINDSLVLLAILGLGLFWLQVKHRLGRA